MLRPDNKKIKIIRAMILIFLLLWLYFKIPCATALSCQGAHRRMPGSAGRVRGGGDQARDGADVITRAAAPRRWAVASAAAAEAKRPNTAGPLPLIRAA